MTPEERLLDILLSTAMGPITPYWGIVNGRCECGKSNDYVPKKGEPPHTPGKHPRFPGWQGKATKDHAQITGWFCQFPQSAFAVITGYDSIVLDLDIREGIKNGVEELAKIEAIAGKKLPPTVTVVSGSGSVHLYFKLPPNLKRLQKPKGTKGIDFLRTRQGVITAGSLHMSGNYYRFAEGLAPEQVELAEIPDWFLEVMSKPGYRAATSSSGTSGSSVDTEPSNFEVPEMHELFAALLKRGPGSKPDSSYMPAGRLRPDELVESKMKKVPMRRYPDDRSHSDAHWAWTLARYCSHHWDQFLRLWQRSSIRNLDDTQCGTASYETHILDDAFEGQKQQWGNFKRIISNSANPALAKKIKQIKNRMEFPRSVTVDAIIGINRANPTLKDKEIANLLNEAGSCDFLITRDYVKTQRKRYPHLWTRKTS